MGWFQQEIESREAAIQAEIAELGPHHPWAGIYVASVPLLFDGRVFVAPRAGYIDHNRPDCGPAFPEYGSVEEVGGQVHFTSFINHRWSVTPVHWGERHYLIPERSFLSFCQAINADTESRSPHRRGSQFLLREGDELIGATGLPTLPEKYLCCIFKQQILATVLDVQEIPLRFPMSTVREFHATVDCGIADGLFVEAKFYELKALKIRFGEIIEVRDHTSLMKVLTLDSEPLRTGAVFTTRPVPGSLNPW